MRSSSAVIVFLLLPLSLSAQEDEAKKRNVFAKEFKDKATAPDKWKAWHKANQAKLVKDDADKLAAWKKSAGKGK